jgi:DNA helicase-2/ATP-dependent DNA helicase PcrA
VVVVTLTHEQTVAATCAAPRVCLIASAGSGKTRVIVERVGNLPADQPVLLFAFTRSAAEVIRERLVARGWTGNVRPTTFHGYAYSLVAEHAEKLGYRGMPTVLADAEVRDIINDVRIALGIGKRDAKGSVRPTRGGPSMEKCLEELSAPGAHADAFPVGLEVRSRMKATNATSYALMVSEAIRLLEDSLIASDERAKWPHVVVDEAADVDARIWTLLDRLNPANLVAVADPSQAIFGFRGGDAEAFTAFACAPGTTRLALSQNFRSRPEIVEAANRVVGGEMVAVRKAGGLVRLGYFDVSDESIYAIARMVVNGNLAFLARENRVVDQFETVLAKQGVASRRIRSLPKPDEGTLLARAALRAYVNPWDEAAVRRVAGRFLPGEAVEEDVRGALSRGAAPGSCLRLTDRVDSIRLMYVDAMTLAESPEIERAESYVAAHRDPCTTDRELVARYLLEAQADSLPAVVDGPDDARITLSTIHSAKGREWRAVVVDCSGLRDNAEDRRLLYTAMTRAEDELYLLDASEWIRNAIEDKK